MAETVVSDAARVPQDEGFPNISDGNEAWNSAGLMSLLGQAAQSGSYVRSDSELDFSSHDGTNDTVDVNAGVAYISLAGETVDVQSGLGGSSQPYDTTITTNTMPAVCVILPSATTVNLQDSTLSSIWLAYDTDGTGPGSAGSVYLRSDDTGSVTAPSHPSVKLGEANPDDSTADVLASRFPSPTFSSISVQNGLVWDEDPNSTFTASAANSITCNLSDTYAYVEIYLSATDNAGSANNTDCTVNTAGTGDYNYVTIAGTQTQGADNFPNVQTIASNSRNQTILRLGESNGSVGLATFIGTANDSEVARGNETVGTYPLNSITFSRGASTDWSVEIYGSGSV